MSARPRPRRVGRARSGAHGRLAASGAALVGLALLACQAPLAEPSVTIRGQRIRVELARTLEERSQGLSGRAPLAPGQGMLFLFPAPARHGIWMRDMRFDLDIVWIRNGRIVHLAERVPHDPVSPLPVYRPPEPADTVLEVVAGTAARGGWRVGDAVAIDAD